MNAIADELNTIMAGEEPLKNLKAVQVDIDRFQILSARNGGATMHEVHLGKENPTCTCEDAVYNKEGNEVCAHVAKAALVADSTFDPDRAGLQASLNVLQQANEATERVRELEEMLGRIDEANRTGRAKDTASDGSSDSGSSAAPDDPVGELNGALEASNAPADKVAIEEDRDYLTLEPDGYLDDDEFSAWLDFVQDADAIEYDGETNRIKKSDVSEVAP